MRYKVGMKIHIIHMEDVADYDGREGYITNIDSIGQLYGTWGTLSIMPNIDTIRPVYEYVPLYYKTPCQVKWYDTITKQYLGGIGFEQYLIKGDGTVALLDDIVHIAINHGIEFDEAVIELEWVDLSHTIWD